MSCGSLGWEASEGDTMYIGESRMCTICIEKELRVREKNLKSKIERKRVKKT
jgi:hypothetical protein